MKKKLLFATLLAAMLAGCASHDEADYRNGQSPTETTAILGETPVSFNVYANRGVSRSGQTGNIVIDKLQKTKESEGGFGVFAYYTDLKKYDQTYVPNFMYNQGVFWNNSMWEYSPVMYWPNEYGSGATSDDEDKVSFFAYAPYVKHQSAAAGSVEDATYGITGFSRNSTVGDPVVKYIASFDPAKSVDLCWGVCDATSWNKIQGGGSQVMTSGLPWIDVEHPRGLNQRMTFTFKHALSQLNVQIDADPDIETHDEATELAAGTKVYVRSISFTGIAMQGALNLNNTVPNTAQWLDYSGTTDLPYGQSVMVKDGRRDGREGASGAEAINETPQGLNPAIIQNSSDTKGVTHKLQNLFQPLPDNAAVDPGMPEDAEIDAAINDPVYVIPTGEAMAVTIVYDVETENPKLSTYLSDGTTHGVSIENRITKTIAFGEEGKGLECGKKYILKLHLGMNSVKFNAAISDWDDSVVNGEGWLPGNSVVSIGSVTAQSFTPPVAPTRGTRNVSEGDSEIDVTFAGGDAFGLYVMSSEGALLKNTKVDYNGAGFSTEIPIPYKAGYEYYLYYPYSSTAPTTSETGGVDADTFFADLISGFTPANDQSTRSKLMQQMLMVGKGTVRTTVPATANSPQITFTLSQTQSLIQLTDTKYTVSGGTYSWELQSQDYSAQEKKPYVNGSKIYYLAKPTTAVTLDGGTSKNVTTGAAATYKAEVLSDNDWTLEVGDLMCDDGSLWKTDGGGTAYSKIVAYNTAQGKSLKPIGIVFSTETSDTDKNTYGFKHGYVMSLYSANNGMRLGQWSTGTVETFTQVTDQLLNTGEMTAQVAWPVVTNELDGYSRCKAATNNFTTFDKDGQHLNAIEAAYNNNLVGKVTPPNTSCWFLPSVGQHYVYTKNMCKKFFVEQDGVTYDQMFPDDWTTANTVAHWYYRSGIGDFYIDGRNAFYTITPVVMLVKAMEDFIAYQGLTPVYGGPSGSTALVYDPSKFQTVWCDTGENLLAAGIVDNGWYWTSDEWNNTDAWYICYQNNQYSYFLYHNRTRPKNIGTHCQVRSVLAF